MKGFCFVVLTLVSVHSFAEPRGGRDEWDLGFFATGSRHYAFEGGASARNHGGIGYGMTWSHNLNNHFRVGIEGTLSEFNYRATVAPGAGNSAAAFERDGSMTTAGLRARATWNLLAQPVTPFLTATAGLTFIETDLGANPPANACWVYPWYGEVCSDKTPNNPFYRFTYGIGSGLLLEWPTGFFRATLGAEWIDFKEALSPVGYVTVRADVGLRF
jgi:hypothetical protein